MFQEYPLGYWRLSQKLDSHCAYSYISIQRKTTALYLHSLGSARDPEKQIINHEIFKNLFFLYSFSKFSRVSPLLQGKMDNFLQFKLHLNSIWLHRVAILN